MDMMLAYKYGLKNLYYANTDDGDKQTAMSEDKETVKVEPKIEGEQSGCTSGACAM